MRNKMLKKFSVKNFKAFKDKVTIDFSSVGHYGFNTESIVNGICNTAIMYGKNAGGKTAICYAMFDIVKTLTDNFVPDDAYKNYKNAFDADGNVFFNYTFKFDNDEIEYSYSKNDFESICSESLAINGITIFKYDKEIPSNIAINIKGCELLCPNTNDMNVSLCRYLKTKAQLENDNNIIIFLKFYDFVEKMLMFWSLNSGCYIGYRHSSMVNIMKYIVELDNFNKLKKFYKDAGYDDELAYERDVNGKYRLYVKYGLLKKDFFDVCSSGMRSVLFLFFWLENCLESKCPSFICIDEFDSCFHYELATYLVKRLKQFKSQILVTTHNTDIFTNKLLRPDCYYICNKKRIVNVRNATDKELRYGNNLEKLYRSGSFED